jgi:hypothetical protein
MLTLFLVSVIMLIASIRASVVMTTLWSSIVLTIMLGMISAFVEQTKVQKAAGAFGILTSAIAAWAGAAGIWTKDQALVSFYLQSYALSDTLMIGSSTSRLALTVLTLPSKRWALLFRGFVLFHDTFTNIYSCNSLNLD